MNGLFDMSLALGCPRERTLYFSAPYIQCGCYYVVYHIECFFDCMKHLEGESIICLGCHNELVCDAGMLLIPPKQQLAVLHTYYINYGVLFLEFLKCGNLSKIE